jgi:hypothetical protein
VILVRKFDKEETRIQAEAKFKRKEAQALEGAKAMAEYEAASRAIVEKTARLKALRLAKEAAEAAGGTAPIISAKKKRFSSPPWGAEHPRGLATWRPWSDAAVPKLQNRSRIFDVTSPRSTVTSDVLKRVQDNSRAVKRVF